MHNGSRTPSDNPAEKRVEWKPDGQQIEPSKKFYLSSTDDDEKSIIRQDQSDSDVNPKPSDCGTSAKDSSERLSKVPTSVILNAADDTIKDGGRGRSNPTPFSRSISEVLRAKLSALPIREEGNFTLGFSKVFHTRTRFLLLCLVLLCLASIWSNILCFNFALLCIEESDHSDTVGINLGANARSERSSDPIFEHLKGSEVQNLTRNSTHQGNGSDTTTSQQMPEDTGNRTDHHTSLLEGMNKENRTKELYSNQQRFYLTSAVAAAALIANFIVVSLVNNYGIRVVFAILGMLSAIATCLIPASVRLGFYYVLGCRVLQGVAFSANFPVIGAFTSKWTYYKQNGLFVSVLVAYVQFAPAVTMPVSGALCSSIGWPSVFYVHGTASAILSTIFIIFFRNSPGKHPLVGDVELRKIAVGKSELSKEITKKIPILEILKTPSVWAIWIAAIGNFVCVNMMFLYTPNYLRDVLKFPVAHAGFSASLAPLAQFSIKLFAGFTSDKIRFLSETNKLRLYNSIAFFGSALFLTFLAFFPTEFSMICVGLLGIAAGLLGFTTGGFFKAGPLVAKHYALVVMGQISLAITFTLLIVPGMVTTLTPQNTPEGWRSVFLCTAAVLCLTNVIFCFMTSAKPAEWAKDDYSRCASHSKIQPVDTSSSNTMHIKQFSATILSNK